MIDELPSPQELGSPSSSTHGGDAAADDVASRMETACRDGNTEQLRELLELGGPLLAADARYASKAVFAACACGKTACLQLLLETKASPHPKASDTSPPVVFACMMGKVEAVELLVRAGVSPMDEHPSFHGPTVHQALGIVQMLASQPDEESANRVQCLEVLMLAAPLQPSRAFVRSVIFNIACSNGKNGIVQLMLRQKMDPNADCHSACSSMGQPPYQPPRGNLHWTPLFRACEAKQLASVRLLLEATANVATSCPTDAGPKTPMQIAQSNDDKQCIRLLVRCHGSKLTPLARCQRPPLCSARPAR